MSEDTVSKDGTDGLVTVLIQKRVISEYDRPWLNSYLPPNKPFPSVWKDEEAGEPHELRALVTRSQAESEIRKVRKDAVELLEAKDARIKELEELCNDTEAEALGYASDKAELEADNAALTSEKQSMLNAMGDMANSNKKLKAKLAAAEKALESYKSIVKDVCESQRGTKWGEAAECIFDAIERAVLGGKL